MSVLTLPSSFAISSPPWRAKAMVYEDPKSAALRARVERVAPSGATVLITGETGTGKEIVARHVHALSSRADRPFLAVNCGAFAESLIESELFGHERGAFTGAVADKRGWFEAAHGGTLFLDEVGDLSPGAQAKLLRVLQEREVVRLGSHRAIPVDVRLVAATNVELAGAVAAGRFRLDLFYRLAVAQLTIAPLRERPLDILPLARHFIEVYAARTGHPANTPAPALTPDAERLLLARPWPGNIRELENAVHHAVLVCRDDRITPDDLPTPAASIAAVAAIEPRGGGRDPARDDRPASAPAINAPGGATRPRAVLPAVLRALYEEGGAQLWNEIEETVIRTAYEHAGFNQLRTARLLGMTRSVVRARLQQFGALPRAI
jgi:sigma-54 dependent transcriptional regulator